MWALCIYCGGASDVKHVAGNLGCIWRGRQATPQEDGRTLLARAKARLARLCMLLIKERFEVSLHLCWRQRRGGVYVVF